MPIISTDDATLVLLDNLCGFLLALIACNSVGVNGWWMESFPVPLLDRGTDVSATVTSPPPANLCTQSSPCCTVPLPYTQQVGVQSRYNLSADSSAGTLPVPLQAIHSRRVATDAPTHPRPSHVGHVLSLMLILSE